MRKLLSENTCLQANNCLDVFELKLYNLDKFNEVEFRLTNNSNKTVIAYIIDIIYYDQNHNKYIDTIQEKNINLLSNQKTNKIVKQIPLFAINGKIEIIATIYEDLSYNSNIYGYSFVEEKKDSIENDSKKDLQEKSEKGLRYGDDVFEYLNNNNGTSSIVGLKESSDFNKIIVVPEKDLYGNSVVYIEKNACSKNIYLEKVVLSNNIEIIEEEAFAGCINLKEVCFENIQASQLVKIEKNAFANCSNLSIFNIPSSVSHIGFNAFINTNIELSLEYKKRLILPDENVQNNDVKSGQSRTENVIKIICYIIMGLSLIAIAMGIIINRTRKNSEPPITKCSHNEIIRTEQVDATCSQSGFTSESYCSECGKVFEVKKIIAKLPHNIQKTEGYSATCTSEGLTDLLFCRDCGEIIEHQSIISKKEHNYINEVCTWCNSELVSSEGLEYKLLDNGTYEVSSIGLCTDTNIIIAKKINDVAITGIGASAFKDCTNINRITIYANLTYIDDYAFSGCTELIKINIPKSIKRMGSYAFENCEKLHELYIEDIAQWCDIQFGYNRTNYFEYYNPMYYAKNLYINNERVTELKIPEGVTEISDWAFTGSKAFQSITIPESLKIFGYGAFESCSNLRSVYISNINNWFKINFGPNGGTSQKRANPLSNGAKLYLNGYLVEQIDVPKDIVKIPSGVFNGCTSIKRVNIPKNIEIIEANAFQSCKNLEYVDIETGSLLSEIGLVAFEYCSNLKTINLPDTLKKIDQWAFSGCDYLQFTLPSGLTSVGYSPFPSSMLEEVDGCIYASNWLISGYYGDSDTVTIREGTIGLADNAFNAYYSNALKTIIIPSSLRYIGEEAFSGNEELKNVIFKGGSQLEHIGFKSFAFCKNIKEIILPNSLKIIDSYAFWKCELLETVTLSAGVETIGHSAFFECSALKYVHWETDKKWNISWNIGYYDPVKTFISSDLNDPIKNAEFFATTYVGYSWKIAEA